MKNQVNESNFVSRFIDKIRKGLSDSVMQGLMRKDPELRQLIQRHKKSEKDYIDHVKRKEAIYRKHGLIK